MALRPFAVAPRRYREHCEIWVVEVGIPWQARRECGRLREHPRQVVVQSKPVELGDVRALLIGVQIIKHPRVGDHGVAALRQALQCGHDGRDGITGEDFGWRRCGNGECRAKPLKPCCLVGPDAGLEPAGSAGVSDVDGMEINSAPRGNRGEGLSDWPDSSNVDVDLDARCWTDVGNLVP